MDEEITGATPVEAVSADTAQTTPEPVQSVADAALTAMDMPTVSEQAEADPKPAADPAKPAAADPKAAKPEVKPADAKAITEEDLQRPENLSHKARDRFEKLVGGYKAEKARADEAHAELVQANESFKALQDLGFRDEAAGRDLVQFAQFRQALATNPKQALQTLQGVMRQIELQHGLRAPSTSALEEYPDLVELVNNEKMDYQHALEVARAREAQAAQQQQNQQFKQRQESDFQQQHATQTAIQTVERMESQWRATNPDYAAIHPHIQSEMQTIARQFPPAMWPQQIDLLYKTISRAMASRARPQSSQPTPLRGNGHAASRPAPKSTAEAALLAMGMSVD